MDSHETGGSYFSENFECKVFNTRHIKNIFLLQTTVYRVDKKQGYTA